MRSWKPLLLCCLCLAFAGNALAQMTVTNTQSLSFGKFVAGSGGTVTISPSGFRSATGSVELLNANGGSAAEFVVSDTDPLNASRSYTITLPADGTVTLTAGSGTMAANTFTSDPQDVGMLTAGSQTVRVGATLSVQAAQAPGAYSGTFSIIINYQ